MRSCPGAGAGRGEGRRLPKAVRMVRDREYREVVLKGERTNTPHFTVYRDYRGAGRRAGIAGAPAAGLIGVSIAKRVAGNATVRNRLKRLLREFYRLHKSAFPPGTRTAIVARKAPAGADLSSVTAELLPAILGRWGGKEGASPCRQGTSS